MKVQKTYYLEAIVSDSFINCIVMPHHLGQTAEIPIHKNMVCADGAHRNLIGFDEATVLRIIAGQIAEKQPQFKSFVDFHDGKGIVPIQIAPKRSA